MEHSESPNVGPVPRGEREAGLSRGIVRQDDNEKMNPISEETARHVRIQGLVEVLLSFSIKRPLRLMKLTCNMIQVFQHPHLVDKEPG